MTTVNGFPPPLPPPPPGFENDKAADYGPTPLTPQTFEERQYLRYIAALQKSMAADTEKLLRLTQEFNAKVEKSGADSLTREDLRTLKEIGKLAHQIKWKMQLTVDESSRP